MHAKRNQFFFSRTTHNAHFFFYLSVKKIKPDTETAQSLFRNAEEAFQAENFDKAKTLYEKIINNGTDIKPTYLRCYIQLIETKFPWQNDDEIFSKLVHAYNTVLLNENPIQQYEVDNFKLCLRTGGSPKTASIWEKIAYAIQVTHEANQGASRSAIYGNIGDNHPGTGVRAVRNALSKAKEDGLLERGSTSQRFQLTDKGRDEISGFGDHRLYVTFEINSNVKISLYFFRICHSVLLR